MSGHESLRGCAGAAPAQEHDAVRSVLDEIDAPVPAATVMLTSGRRYDLDAGAEADRLVVRSRGGDVVLRIEITDAGPVLSFSGASVELQATRRLHLSAHDVSIEAKGDVAIAAGGSMREAVAGDHHTRVKGTERVEAAAVEVQANEGAVGVRAMGRIALDGEHVGLNDEPLPRPYAWSEIADEPGEG